MAKQAISEMSMPAYTQRKTRGPEHRWRTNAYPWELHVCALAPVLPGERLRRAVWQARVVTDPLVAPLIGWWLEYYLFYVPLSQMGISADVVADVESGTLDTQFASSTAADATTYYAGRGINWALQCRDVIVREWFREEDEESASPAPYIRTSPNRPAVKTSIGGIHNSLRLTSAWPGGTGTLGATQVAQEDAYRTWDFLRTQGLMQMTYEDWLLTYGVRNPEAVKRTRPYLLRYVRNWQYPSNTVDPASGVPKTAVSWGITESANKPRGFQEPGFLVLMSTARPKVYYTNQEAHGATVMDRLKYWMPAILRDDPMLSMREDGATASPLYDTVQAAAWTLDVRDLLIHGDQWLDASSELAGVALPTSGAEPHYATAAMAQALFTDPLTTGAYFVKQDGVCRFSISANARDAVDVTATS